MSKQYRQHTSPTTKLEGCRWTTTEQRDAQEIQVRNPTVSCPFHLIFAQFLCLYCSKNCYHIIFSPPLSPIIKPTMIFGFFFLSFYVCLSLFRTLSHADIQYPQPGLVYTEYQVDTIDRSKRYLFPGIVFFEKISVYHVKLNYKVSISVYRNRPNLRLTIVHNFFFFL